MKPDISRAKLGLTKVRSDLFLMLINPIAPNLTVPNGTVIPERSHISFTIVISISAQAPISTHQNLFELRMLYKISWPPDKRMLLKINCLNSVN